MSKETEIDELAALIEDVIVDDRAIQPDLIAAVILNAGYGKLPAEGVWHSTPEPEGVLVVNDDTDNEGEDSNRWGRTFDGQWKGYKDGGKVYLEWAELERRWGPITW